MAGPPWSEIVDHARKLDPNFDAKVEQAKVTGAKWLRDLLAFVDGEEDPVDTHSHYFERTGAHVQGDAKEQPVFWQYRCRECGEAQWRPEPPADPDPPADPNRDKIPDGLGGYLTPEEARMEGIRERIAEARERMAAPRDDPWDGRPRRDARRIGAVMFAVEKLWRQHPDLRLGQIVVNATTAVNGSVPTIEDDMLLEGFRALTRED